MSAFFGQSGVCPCVWVASPPPIPDISPPIPDGARRAMWDRRDVGRLQYRSIVCVGPDRCKAYVRGGAPCRPCRGGLGRARLA
eukprot:3766860-Prymnesium_polylepis.1